MSSITGLISGGGGGGTPINGIAKFNKTDITFTDDQNQVWLKSGNVLTSGLANYPDADITKGLLDNVTYSNNSISTLPSYTSQPRGLCFNNDGTKLFMAESSSGVLFRFNLPTPYSLSGATLSESHNISADGNSILDLFFSPDGTKYYTAETVTDQIKQYNCPTPFSFSGSTRVAAIGLGSNPQCVNWSGDGKILYIKISSSILGYSVNVPYDLTNSVSKQVCNVNITSLNGYIDGLNMFKFNKDGTKAYFMTEKNIYVARLSSPYKIDGLEFMNSFFSSSAVIANSTGFVVANNDSKLYISDNTNYIVAEFNLGEGIGQPYYDSPFDYIRIK